MRTLTEAEAKVVGVLLAARADRERDRLRQLRMPRSTYHAVRRRAYEEGWVKDRYVPDPGTLQRPFVSFTLARPYLDHLEEFERAFTGSPDAVALWIGSLWSLGVSFHSISSKGVRPGSVTGSVPTAAWSVTITVPSVPATVPVYFDYEGLWSHFAMFDGTLAYPHGLSTVLDENDGRPALSPHQRWAMAELLHRPFSVPADGGGPHLVGPLGLPFSQLRLLRRGWVTHRTFLEPNRVPSYRGRSFDRVVMVFGTPRSEARAERLFAALAHECWVYPFLFVVGSDRWLLGALAGPRAPDGSPVDLEPRRPVLATVQEYLEGIEILQEPLLTWRPVLDHRYDRLLARDHG